MIDKNTFTPYSYFTNKKEVKKKMVRTLPKYKKRMSACLNDMVLKDHEDKYKYMMLSRHEMDADAYLSEFYPHNHLWAGDAIEHAYNMVAIWKSFRRREKPQWLTKKRLRGYVKQLVLNAHKYDE